MQLPLVNRFAAVPRPVWSPRFLLAIVGCSVALLVWLVLTRTGGDPVDARDFFVDPARPYLAPGFLYSPPAGDVFGILGAAGFPAFVAAIRGAELVALAWFAGPALPLAIVLPPVAAEINAANINLLLMACVVLGFRWPALWSVVLLTKPTMGVGLVWFALRREWRTLRVVLGVTLAIAVVSFAIQPATWAAYAQTIMAADKNGGWPFPWPIWERAVVFVPVVIWASRTGRRWAVVVAVILAAPRFYFLSLGMLVALWRTDPGGIADACRQAVAGLQRGALVSAERLRDLWRGRDGDARGTSHGAAGGGAPRRALLPGIVRFAGDGEPLDPGLVDD